MQKQAPGFYLILFALLLISFRKNTEQSFLDKTSSNTIKGFFILLIVFSHILQAFPYNGILSTPLAYFRTILGQLCVSMFFFISGYGIILSIQKNQHYSTTLFSNRFFRIFIYTLFGLIPYFVYFLCTNNKFQLSDYFLSLIGLGKFGNWFIFAILFCYLVSAFTLLFKWKTLIIPCSIISLCVVAYIALMYVLQQPAYFWDTIICFSYGMIVGIFKEKMYLFISRKKTTPFILMLFSLLIVTALQFLTHSSYSPYHLPEIIEMWFANAFFCIFFLCLTKLFTLKSLALSYFGQISFAICIIHKLPIYLFTDLIQINNSFLLYTLLFTSCISIGIPLNLVYKPVNKIIVNPVISLNKKIANRISIEKTS